ncbi:hypothetical protein BGI41_03680 [Methanobrevibacter sp. 87.7]|uniref:hypothetical protein n=1 Tax=Methanobrevibacter sp. 87.7 TaxID=387957 RepID=UPI000B50DECA|nr:hypothetical protein [Methanobrevibacter sp. 87.7]OWT33193.1 hypothetical protein BGI41_03680 [Methanobrevibacter sp. 87.7]
MQDYKIEGYNIANNKNDSNTSNTINLNQNLLVNTNTDNYKKINFENTQSGYINTSDFRKDNTRYHNLSKEDTQIKNHKTHFRTKFLDKNNSKFEEISGKTPKRGYEYSKILNPEITLENLDNIKKQNLVPDPNESNEPYSYLYLGLGTLIIGLGLFDTIRSKRSYSLIFVIIGIIVFSVGLYKSKNYNEKETRGRIIRSKLLTLPENYYILYYVKVPGASDGINHVVIGPTGIYTILTQKFNDKEDKDRIKQENETQELISLLGDNSDERLIPDDNPITSRLINPEHKYKFEHNNRIKQKTIKLAYELEDFLMENGLECPIYPYVGFVNLDVVVLNNPLIDEDFFINELLNKIVKSDKKIDLNTVHKCAILLTQYSTKCSN